MEPLATDSITIKRFKHDSGMMEFGSVFLDSPLVPVIKMVKDQIDSAIRDRSKRQQDLINIKTDLEELEPDLTDAENWSTNEEASKWLEKLTGVIYDISDKIYELEANTAPATRKITMANIMKKMKDVRNEMSTQCLISKSSNSFSIQRKQGIKYRETSGDMKTQIIGRTEDKQKAMCCLSESITQQIMILPIYGIAGIGKTTLARMVFNSSEFKYYSRVWVYVSPTFDLKKIGNSMISQVSEKGSTLVEMGMIHDHLQEALAGKNILIVLDDLWERDPSQLQCLRYMLEFGDRRKMVVMVTTPDEAVAREICTVQPYKLAPLTDKMCWDIIKQGSVDFEHSYEKEKLELIGTDIATNCGGVASAAESLAYLLSGKVFHQWEAVSKGSDIWHRGTGSVLSRLIFSSLLLSYNKMPSYLQLCFAYCAILPRGHIIVKEDLIQQWIALGFIKPCS